MLHLDPGNVRTDRRLYDVLLRAECDAGRPARCPVTGGASIWIDPLLGESPDVFVFAGLTGSDTNADPLDGPPAARFGFVVRCSVPTGQCERASDQLTVPADDDLVLAGDPA